MGIEGIEISKLSGKLQQLATAADDGNGVIENNEIEIFKGYADAAVKNGQVSEDDYKAIFGADIKTTQPATTSSPVEEDTPALSLSTVPLFIRFDTESTAETFVFLPIKFASLICK